MFSPAPTLVSRPVRYHPNPDSRQALEEIGELQPYVSALDEDLEKLSSSDSEEEERTTRKKERPKVSRSILCIHLAMCRVVIVVVVIVNIRRQRK
ncbi:unnamed protein product [Toxocara canis]|uniref:Polyprotein n=1 Tax=Toxocara canis TaxID=6265 RepID=A0A183UYC8_TOXCA|nr:unnamed protein product [Toxocara canis]